MPATLSAPKSSAKRRVQNRRRYPRFPCGPYTFSLVMIEPGGPLNLAGVRNVSRSGVGLILNRPVDAGRIVTVNLFNWKRNFATRVPMRVIHCSPLEDGMYVLGGAFTQDLSDEEVQWVR